MNLKRLVEVMGHQLIVAESESVTYVSDSYWLVPLTGSVVEPLFGRAAIKPTEGRYYLHADCWLDPSPESEAGGEAVRKMRKLVGGERPQRTWRARTIGGSTAYVRSDDRLLAVLDPIKPDPAEDADEQVAYLRADYAEVVDPEWASLTWHSDGPLKPFWHPALTAMVLGVRKW